MVTDDKVTIESKDKKAKKATENDKKGFDLDEGKITRKEFSEAMGNKGAMNATEDGEDDVPKDQTKGSNEADAYDERIMKYFDSRDENIDEDARDYARFLN